MHTMGSVLLKMPELALTHAESETLATAITNVTELYEIPLLDAKSMAWVNLGMTAAGIYAPRIVAYSFSQRAKEKEQAPKRPTIINAKENVVQQPIVDYTQAAAGVQV